VTGRLVPALVAATVVRSLYTGFGLHFRLVPDTAGYASGHLLSRAPLTTLVGLAGGVAALTIVGALAAGSATALVAELAQRSGRSALVAVVATFLFPLTAWWLLFPGADALGLAFFLLYVATRNESPRIYAVALALAALAHPVVLASAGGFEVGRRIGRGARATAWLTLAGGVVAVVIVSALDVPSTTGRYLLPGWFLLAAVYAPRLAPRRVEVYA